MRRRTLLVAFGVFAACADPYEAEIPPPDAPVRDAGGNGDTAAPDARVEVDAATDAPVDAGSDVDPCDRDKDGFREKSSACSGDDCDDDDGRTHPDAGFVTDPVASRSGGDWNCSGVVERQYGDVNVNCTSFLITSCTGKQGFGTDPPCGSEGQYVVCKSNGVSCIVDTVEQRRQGCR